MEPANKKLKLPIIELDSLVNEYYKVFSKNKKILLNVIHSRICRNTEKFKKY